MKKYIFFLISAVMFITSACKNDDKNEKLVPVSDVTLNTTELNLLTGSSQTLMVTVTPADASYKSVNWSSTNASVVTVNLKGEIVAVKSGEANIVVTSLYNSNFFATCRVTVEDPLIPVTGVKLDETELMLTLGAKKHLTVSIEPFNATNQGIKWSSSDDNVATVNDGEITAIDEGKTTIKATSLENDAIFAICEVTVENITIPVTSVTLDETNLMLNLGEQITLTVSVKPDEATNKDVEWTSSNDNVATVIDGVVTVTGLGKAIIKAISLDNDDVFATCEVLVIKNLLENSGFEDPDNNVTTDVSPWVVMTQTDLSVDGENTSYGNSNRTDKYINGGEAGFWVNSGTPRNFTPRGGAYCGRLPVNATNGLYQIVDVTPGKTYVFKVYILNFRNNTNQNFKPEKLRIKSADGLTTLKSVDLNNPEYDVWMEVSGEITIPDGTDQIRFQISQIRTDTTETNAGRIIDDCMFYQIYE